MVFAGVGFVLLNLCCTRMYWRMDITNDKRYTLSENTRQLLEKVDRPIHLDIFLAGSLPPGMQKLQYALTRMVEEFRRISGGNFRYDIIDPAEISDIEEKKALVKYLADRGIQPVSLNRRTEDETLSQQYIFPGLLVYDHQTEVSVGITAECSGSKVPSRIFNHSIEALEYELDPCDPPVDA